MRRAIAWAQTDAGRDTVFGAAVAVAGLLGAVLGPPGSLLYAAPVAIGTGVAVACFRRAAGVALALIWIVAWVQLVGSVTPGTVGLLGVVVVAYGTARHGSTLVVWASGLSIPLAALFLLLGRALLPFPDGAQSILVPSGALLLLGVAALTVPFFVPWLVGLLMRHRDTARRSRQREDLARSDRDAADAARARAQEVAELRERQNRLARDVHDVVGHSLTVILAQAEAAKYLPRDEPERLRDTMDTIATSARRSLHDVRTVLAADDETMPVATASRDTLDGLIAGVRASGADVRSRVVGEARPLPPELDAVAYRTLQEMLTNALKHGDRSAPVHVEQHWEGELRLEVGNRLTDAAAPDGLGRGLEGMRARLASVGGRLDVRRRDGDADGSADGSAPATFTATAWIPVRG